MTKKLKSKKGFTLIELMIVVVIIGILAAMAVPRFFSTTVKTRQVEAKELLRQMYTMQMTYRQQYDSYWGQGLIASAAAPTAFARIGVDIGSTSVYTYVITTATATSFICQATCSVLDDDPAQDIWQIDEQGSLVPVSDDVVN